MNRTRGVRWGETFKNMVLYTSLCSKEIMTVSVIWSRKFLEATIGSGIWVSVYSCEIRMNQPLIRKRKGKLVATEPWSTIEGEHVIACKPSQVDSVCVERADTLVLAKYCAHFLEQHFNTDQLFTTDDVQEVSSLRPYYVWQREWVYWPVQCTAHIQLQLS